MKNPPQEFGYNLYRSGHFSWEDPDFQYWVDRIEPKIIVCLRKYADPHIIHECDRRGIRFLHLPLCSCLPPSRRQLNRVLRVFCHARTEGPMLVYCKDGVDRTGLCVACWRVRNGEVDRKDAIKEMIAMGNHLWLRWWTFFVR